MAEGRDDLVRIDVTGVAHPVGETARVRLQGRQGSFHVLPSPPHVVFLRREAAEGDARACVLSGEIRAPGVLFDVATFLGQTGKKGELIVLDRGSSRSVYFDEGYVLAARSSVVSERLGEALLRAGVLTETQLAACREATTQNPLRLGEAAVELGFVARDRLFSQMAVQTQEIFFAALQVSAGGFYFLEGFDEAELSVRHRLSVPTLVRDTVKRIHEERFFRTRIPSARHVPVASGTTTPSEPELQVLYQALDGARSIAELSRHLSITEFEATRGIFQLVQAGHAAVRPPRLRATEAVGVYNDAVSLLLRELDATDDGDGVRVQLATRVATTPLAPLLADAGPSDDGRYDAERVAANVAARKDARAVEDALGRLLHEHASYALFLARPHLQRAQSARQGGTETARISQAVSGLLEPIAPAAGARASRTAPPPAPRRKGP